MNYTITKDIFNNGLINNISYHIYELQQKCPALIDDLMELYEVHDYEDILEEEGWEKVTEEGYWYPELKRFVTDMEEVNSLDDEEHEAVYMKEGTYSFDWIHPESGEYKENMSPDELADDLGLESTREVFEHWLVTDNLARWLREQGATVVEEFLGLENIWLRTCTGQMCYMDFRIPEREPEACNMYP